MPRKPSKNDTIIDTALDLAAEKGWRQFTLADVARQSKIPLSELYPIYPDKTALLAGYIKRTDRRMLQLLEADELAPEANTSPRERLFDVIMIRFDALSPEKDAIRAILAGIRRDAVTLAALAPSLRRSVFCILEAAEINTGSIRGALWPPVLAAILARVSATWLDDETEDAAATMAALDRYLTQTDKLRRVFASDYATKTKSSQHPHDADIEEPAS